MPKDSVFGVEPCDCISDPKIGQIKKRDDIKTAIATEEEQFRKTLENGLKQFNKISLQVHVESTIVNGKIMLDLDWQKIAVN